MTFVDLKLNAIVPVLAVACISLACSTFDPENHAAQNTASAANIIEIECGEHILEARIDNLTPEQEKELETLKTRCRIDTVARKLEVKPSLRSQIYSDPANKDRVGPDVGR